MSMFGRALAGVGTEAAAIGNKYIDEQLAQQRLQAIADIQRTSAQQQREDADAFNNDPMRVLRDRANKVADVTDIGTAKGNVDLQTAIATATNPQLTTALTAREAAAAKAKADNTPYDLSPGQRRLDPVTGKVLAENDRPTAAEVSRDAFAAGQKGNLGKTTRADHYDDKEWDAVRKVDPALVSFPDAMGGKGVESPELRQVFRTELTRLQQVGDFSPNEASDAARNTTLKLKNAALDRVEAAKAADPKSTLTEQRAVQQLLQEFAARQKAAAAASVTGSVTPAAGSGTAVPPDQSTAESARVTRQSLADKAAASVAGAPDPSMTGMTSFQLQNIAASGRMSATKRAAAQAELDRRKATVSAPGQGADLTDPATYAQ